jgi:hypothetical protein
MTGRHGTLVGGLVLVLVVAAGAAYLALRDPDGRSASRSCNGSEALCALRLDQVSLAATHNSMNAAADGFRDPSQEVGIGAQLDQGVRGLLVDAYLGVVRTAGSQPIVYTDVSDKRLGTLANAVGDEEVQHALRLREEAGRPPADAPRDVYLCHSYCELGAVLFSDTVRVLRNFLEGHSGEVLVMIIQDELDAEQLVTVLEEGGLEPYLASLDPGVPLPTLEEMVESGHRLVIGLENGDLAPLLPNVYDGGLVQEVPYDYSSLEELEDPRSCRPHRGRDGAPLFLLNHWVTPPSPEVAAEANVEDVLLDRARRCSEERGRPVNLVAVDFAGSGDLFAAVEALNDQSADEPSS